MFIDDIVNEAKKVNDMKLKKFNAYDKKMKLGIMGGTFDPIHNAHLSTAEFIKEKFNLDKIMFIPSGNPPHKSDYITDKYDRYNMVMISIKENEDFILSDIEIKREKKTYTIDTLRELNSMYSDIELYFITGADAICEADTWKEASENFKMTTFIAATRPGVSNKESENKINKLIKEYNANISRVYVPSLEISSTYIRNRIKNEKSAKYLIQDCVEKYIYENKLYIENEMNLDEIKDDLKKSLSPKRYRHSENVAECAVRLSEIYGYDKEKAYIAGILHDCAKCLSYEEAKYYTKKYNISLDNFEIESLALSHGIIGAYIAKYKYKVRDENIINSIKYHTTGKENMDILEKIIYIADMIEDGRDFPGVEKLRELSYNRNIDDALFVALNSTIKFVIENNQLVHPRSIDARNYIMNQILKTK